MKTGHKDCLARFYFLRSKRFVFYLLLPGLLVACVTALAQAQGQPSPGVKPPPDALDYNAPWPGDKVIQPNVNYQRAMDAARNALERKDYPKAIAEANRALKYKTQDAAALKLKEEAETRRSEALAQAALDRNYHRAMTAAHAAFDRGDYTKAMSETDRALELKPDDADAKALKASIQTRQGGAAVPESSGAKTP